MAQLEQGGEEIVSPAAMRDVARGGIVLPRVHWWVLLAISIFWFALNFHWAALGVIILPSQILKMVGDAHKGEALAFVLVPGAFVSLFANPLFGLLSDRTRGWLATWGRRRPYIVIGTLANVVGLVWMAAAGDIVSLMLAYVLVQLANNAAQAPFHAFLPDIVPPEQRGLASGIMGILQIGGSIGGVLAAGLLIDANKPLAAYQQSLWLIYSIIIVVMVALMVVTIFAIREGAAGSAQALARDERELEEGVGKKPQRVPWLTRKLVVTVGITVVAVGLVWGVMSLWNLASVGNVQISSDVQQVVLEVVATVGLLRIFDFHPRRDPDFAWVLLTRLLMMLGIYTIQTFFQYYMKDVIHVVNPEQQTTAFTIVVSLTSLVSALAAGWLSDRLGRKLMVYISGSLMALVGLIFILPHTWIGAILGQDAILPAGLLVIVMSAGALFGLGYGAYQSVDWALVADVLPSEKNFARDMGVWNVSLSLPQVIAPVLGGPLIDYFARGGNATLGFQVLFGMAIVYCLISTVTVRNIRGGKG